MGEALAELIRVSKSYGPVTALRDVTLRVDRGDFLVVSGRSGSGKSTLLAVLGSLTTPTAGDVRLFGRSVSAMSDAERSLLRATRLGYTFQFAGLLPTLTAYDNVRLSTVFGNRPGRETDLEARDLLRRVGLGDRLGAYAEQLSGGEQRRVAIARALLGRRELLLADEPTGDLDSQTEREIMEILAELHREGLTIVMVTHHTALRGYGTRAVEMRDGQLVELE